MTFLLVALVLSVFLAIAAFVPMFQCDYCYLHNREPVRCLNVARSEHYPESVQRMYEEQVRLLSCKWCGLRGRLTLLQWMNWRFDRWLRTGILSHE